MPIVHFLFWIALAGLGGVSYITSQNFLEDFKIFSSEYGRLSAPYKEGTLLFGGDIMLARSVEEIAKSTGYAFPFLFIHEIVEKSDLAIANFEGSVPKEHIQTPPKGMKFSIPLEGLKEVKAAGFDIVSLSNNHALDYGEAGYASTKEHCAQLGLVCVGHPFKHSTSSLFVQKVGDARIGFLMLHTLYQSPSTTLISALVDELKRTSDIQFAFIHWGDEYQPLHNSDQEALAHFLIQHGIDAVIGHHPHVEQDIELYEGKPIFYSLGNLIFDQFFSDAVKEGYLIKTNVQKDSITYSLLPYELHTEPTQPRISGGEARAERLRTLLRYPLFTKEEIEKGTFSVLRN